MAIYDGKCFRGPIGKISFRNRGGRQIAQSKPGAGKVHQTEGTKACSADFGLASTVGGVIRRAFSPLFYSFKDGGMVNRMVSAVTRVIRTDILHQAGSRNFCMGDVGMLSGFDFNRLSPLRNTLGVTATAELKRGKLLVSLPALNTQAMKIPSGAKGCLIRVKAVIFDFENKRYKPLQERQLDWMLSTGGTAAQQWEIEALAPAGCLVITGLSAEFYAESSGIRKEVTREASAAALIGVSRIDEDTVEAGEIRAETTGNALEKSGVPGKGKTEQAQRMGRQSELDVNIWRSMYFRAEARERWLKDLEKNSRLNKSPHNKAPASVGDTSRNGGAAKNIADAPDVNYKWLGM